MRQHQSAPRRIPMLPSRPLVKSAFLAVMALGSTILAERATAAPVYADILVTSSGTSPIASGNVLGAPDREGVYFGNPAIPGAFIEVGFSSPIYDGPGADLHIFDIDPLSVDPQETVDVFASNDGSSFVFVGSAAGGSDSAQGLIDIGGLFSGPISFLKIVQTSTSDAYDLDAVGAFYSTMVVPVPAAVWLFGSGLASILLVGRKKAPLSLAPCPAGHRS